MLLDGVCGVGSGVRWWLIVMHKHTKRERGIRMRTCFPEAAAAGRLQRDETVVLHVVAVLVVDLMMGRCGEGCECFKGGVRGDRCTHLYILYTSTHNTSTHPDIHT